MKYIKKMSSVPLDPINGSVVDTFNVEDKTTNAPSIRAVEDKLNSDFIKGEICTVNGTTDSSGTIECSVTKQYSASNSVFVLSNISSSAGSPYRITVNYYNSATSKVNLRVRKASDNSAISNTSINTTILVCGM